MTSRVEPGPILAVIATVVGLLAGERAGGTATVAPVVVGVAVLTVSVVVMRWPRVVLACVALVLLGSGTMQRALHGMEHSPVIELRDVRASVIVRGTVADDPDGTRFSTSLLVRAVTIATARDPTRDIPTDRIVLVRATGRDAGELRVVATGDHVTLTGRIEALDGFDARLRWRHVVARLDDARIVEFNNPTNPLPRAASLVRATTVRGTRALAPRDRALFLGFVLGDTRDVADDVVDAYRDAGLSHLLAVSGANVAFVLALARPLLERFGLGGRAAMGAGIVVVFAAATRFEPSVLRASVMAVVAMAAMFAGRPVSPIRLLALAVVALLLADPFLLHSVGFALSVGASTGIALFATRLARHLPGPRWVREPLAVTLAAQVGVAPVLVPVFGGVPAVALVSNLLAAPVAEPLSIYGLVASLVLSLFPPLRPLGVIVHAPTTVMVHWITFVARTCAEVPLVLDGRAIAATLAAVCMAAAAVRTAGTLRRDAE